MTVIKKKSERQSDFSQTNWPIAIFVETCFGRKLIIWWILLAFPCNMCQRPRLIVALKGEQLHINILLENQPFYQKDNIPCKKNSFFFFKFICWISQALQHIGAKGPITNWIDNVGHCLYFFHCFHIIIICAKGPISSWINNAGLENQSFYQKHFL